MSVRMDREAGLAITIALGVVPERPSAFGPKWRSSLIVYDNVQGLPCPEPLRRLGEQGRPDRSRISEPPEAYLRIALVRMAGGFDDEDETSAAPTIETSEGTVSNRLPAPTIHLGAKGKMRVAFDLDDTLIRGAVDFPIERQGVLARVLGHEPVREGTIALLKSLARSGWDVWIYTTSFRSPAYVRWLFRLYGIRLGGVINQYHHHKTVTRCGRSYRNCSKYPPAFGIDLLVDESEGVWLESRRHGFEMVWVGADDPAWTDSVVAKARSMTRGKRER